MAVENPTLIKLMDTKDKKSLEQYISKFSQDVKSSEDFLALGIAYHNLALIKEDLETSTKAVELLKKAGEFYEGQYNKKNPLILIYLGSSYTLLGRDSKKIAQKVSNVNTGLAFIDKAVSLDSNNITLRIIRASNSLELPEMFGRDKKIKEDLAYLDPNSNLALKIKAFLKDK
jgi:tetratricopeptide (TPR) repeat protein